MDKATRRRRARARRYNASDKGKAARARYEGSRQATETRRAYDASPARKAAQSAYDASEARTQARTRARLAGYLGRPVVAVDGEGITGPDGRHRYVYLAASDGSSITDLDGLRTVDALGFLVGLKERNPGAVFVSYGFGYDANKILADLPTDKVSRLRAYEYTLAGPWRLWWRPGRHFGVGNSTESVTIWDMRAYFRGPFLDACVSFLGKVSPIIEAGKAARHTFTAADMPRIREYNAAELEATVDIATQLRHRLAAVNITPPRMDGAGSIASELMAGHNMLNYLPQPPAHIKALTGYAFTGGRIEALRYGHSSRGGWQYDMRAAYPWALTQLPSWKGHWESIEGDPGQIPFTMYQVAWWGWRFPTMAAPLPYRTAGGAMVYPSQGRAIIWAPEMQQLREMTPHMVKHKVERAWVFHPADPEHRPWAWVADVYKQRQTMAAAGDPAATVLKLGMAAIWGKLAQRAGWDQTTGRLPKYHHLAAAGYATSLVRAAVYDMARTDLDSLVSIETDAVVTSRRLTHAASRLGPDMGQWKETRLDTLTYCGPGLAWADTAAGPITRTAGWPAGTIDRAEAVKAMRAGSPVLNVTRQAFIGAAQCDLAGSWEQWGQWVQLDDAVALRPQGKRIPYPKLGPVGVWSPTVCPVLPDEHSHPHKLPWELDDDGLAEYIRQEYIRSSSNDQDLT